MIGESNRGLGLTTGQAVTSGVAIAGSSTVGALVAVGAIGGPIGAAIGGAIGLLGMAFNSLFAPDTQKIQATQDVNQEEVYLKQNLAQWDSEPQTIANQQAAETVFNQVWAQTVSLLSNPALGSAGTTGISDRQRGGKLDWFALYYDPIADVTPIDAGTVSGTLTGLFGSDGALMVGGAIAVVGAISLLNKS